MSDDPDKPVDSNRTVFVPGGEAEPASAPPSPPPAAIEVSPGRPAETSSEQATVFAPAPPKAPPTVVGPGVVLNNIYEVKRFLARGGMGEVYEGFNVNTDEPVAIKVMLPALAADPNVQAMFRKEARTLTRLHHPAVVNYRVLAQEPQLNVFYIVTEFIDGAPLSDMLGELDASPEELRALTRRLAEGLGAAHALGAVHRDMSPDNVLLPDRKLTNAKIIDFGIAKDMDPSKGTIVGDGFAGKLGYVAPEQFGDFDRQVGPWTDVYSLGLVILAVVQKRNVDMGATLVEAVDKRRAGPDLGMVPDGLRPVLQAMLTADPAQRLRSMEAVVAALDAIGRTAAPTPKKPARAAPPAAPARDKAPPKPRDRPNRLPLIVGGAVVVLALAAGGVLLATSGGKPRAPAAAPLAAQTSSRHVIEGALPGIACSWLDLTDVSGGPQGLSVRLGGVAGRPAAAQGAISGAASRAGMVLANLDLAEVAPVGEPLCSTLDAVRAFRAHEGGGLSTPQRKFEMVKQDNGKLAARAVITMAPRHPGLDFALVGLEPTGKMDVIFPSRAAFNQIKASQPPDSSAIADLGRDSYRIQLDTDHRGWSGMLLITGRGPFDPKLLQGDPAARGTDWADRFRAAAAQGGWQTDMVWYRTVSPGEN
ncbi:MAG: serine/threonine-protein kinase [Phenylobacterium sp.]